MPTIAERLATLRASRRQTLRALAGLDEAQLGLPVQWRERPSDVRYLLLRLADADDGRRVALGPVLEALGWRQPEAARILAGRGGLIRSLLVGLPEELYSLTPSPGEWSVGQVLEHVRLVDERYLIQTEYAVERLGASETPIRVPDNRLPPIAGEPIAAPTLDEALARLETIGDTVNARLSSLDDSALSAPTHWAGWSVDVRFRLHRFVSHERQHSVQIAKTLQAIGWRPSEAQMILGLAVRSRAALEGTLLGCPDDLLARLSGVLLPSIESLLDQALADEEGTRVAAVKAIQGR